MASPAEAERLLGISRARRNVTLVRPDLHPNQRRQCRGPFGPADRRVAPRCRARAARRAAVGAVGPHRRGDRPAGLRQDPRPAHPGPARCAGRRAGDADEARTCCSAFTERVPPTAGRVWCSTRSAWPPGSADELVWDPVAGCVDPMVAERRAKAFTAGTVKGAITGGTGDDAARFYAAEAAKVLQALLPRRGADRPHPRARPAVGRQPGRGHRAGRDPARTPARRAVLARPAARRAARRRPHRRQHRSPPCSRRCRPVLPGRHPPPLRPRPRAPGHRPRRPDPAPRHHLPARPRGPLRLGVPLMTAVAEHVLDTALAVGHRLPWGAGCARRCWPCSTSCPPPRRCRPCGPGWPTNAPSGCRSSEAAQTWRQLTAIFGEHEARALLGLTNVLVVFGGSKDVAVQPGDLRPARHRPHRPRHQLADRHDGRADRSPATTSPSCDPRRSASSPNARPW